VREKEREKEKERKKETQREYDPCASGVTLLH